MENPKTYRLNRKLKRVNDDIAMAEDALEDAQFELKNLKEKKKYYEGRIKALEKETKNEDE